MTNIQLEQLKIILTASHELRKQLEQELKKVKEEIDFMEETVKWLERKEQ